MFSFDNSRDKYDNTSRAYLSHDNFASCQIQIAFHFLLFSLFPTVFLGDLVVRNFEALHNDAFFKIIVLAATKFCNSCD